MEHFQIVAAGFRIGGLLIGVPSLCAALYFGFALLQTQAPVQASAPIPGESQNLITVLMTGARLFGRVAGFLTEISRAVIIAVLGIATCLTAFSAGMYFTGRGLAAHQAWARISGMTMAFVLVAMWLTGLMPMRWGPISLLLTSAACYALWVLWRMA
ncbi:MAG: hypothetical protein HY820_15570 [Acidobacteria bacterium]|nr:hypothetical protein [Acidobacteriota bacterium]